MNKVIDMKKDKTIKHIILASTMVMILLWINTFIHQNSFSEGLETFTYIGHSVLIAAATIFYYWTLSPLFEEDIFENSTRLYTTVTVLCGVVILFLLFLELGTDAISVYGQREIILWAFAIPKRYAFDIWAIVVFPSIISAFFKVMQKEKYTLSAVTAGTSSILFITLCGYMIFMAMPNIWLVNLMILNTISVGLAIHKYYDKRIKKLNAIAAVILYAFVHMGVLPFVCTNAFIYEGDWDYLTSGISVIIKNASFFGISNYLLQSEYVHSFLADNNKPILQILYYGGWISVVAFIILLLIFMYLILKLLGIENRYEHRNWVVFSTAALHFSIRIIMGLLYSFGFPFPIALPFLGINYITDTIAFTLLLIGAWENHKISQFLKIESSFLDAADVFAIQDEYCITNESGTAYTEESYEEDVDIIGKEGTIIHCSTEWYMLKERIFCVFSEKTLETNCQRFILEYVQTKWKALENTESDLEKNVIREYLVEHKPSCMVSDGGRDDEDN